MFNPSLIGETYVKIMNTFRVIGLVLITVFYGIYIAKQMMLRAKGIDSARLGKGSKPVETSRQERVLMVVTVAVAVLQYVTLLLADTSALYLFQPCAALRFAGVVVGCVGVVYFACAVSAMRDNWRAGIDSSQQTELVTEGIYRFSRNPAFVGFDLLYVGFAMLFPTWLLIPITVMALLLFHLQVLNEEKYLKDRFGQAYADYAKRTLRY